MGLRAASVYVVEGDAGVRRTLELVFRREGFDVRTATDGGGLVDVLTTLPPDLAVLELRPRTGPDGFDMADRVRQYTDAAVMVLSDVENVDDRIRAFDRGADAHLLKPLSTMEVVARARALLRRTDRLAPPVLTVGDLVVEDGGRTVVRAGNEVALTRTEYDLLGVLLRHPCKVMSKQRLIAHVWDGEPTDPNVVEVHMSALRRKLEAHGPRLIHTVRSMGYVCRAAG